MDLQMWERKLDEQISNMGKEKVFNNKINKTLFTYLSKGFSDMWIANHYSYWTKQSMETSK